MTPYQVLGLSVDATEEAIKHAYRTLARECHPDFHPGDPVKEARFKALGEAYFTLGDPTRRHTYDHPPVPDLVVKTKRHEYRAAKLYAAGDLADLYLATAEDGATVLLKIARHERVNDLLEAEAARLLAIETLFAPFPAVNQFVPVLKEHAVVHAGSARRHVNVFAWLPGYRSLADLRTIRRKGVDGRHVAWIGNRLFSLLGFLADATSVVHAGVTPEHVLIHPETHALLLVDWTASVDTGTKAKILAPARRAWYPPEVLDTRPLSPQTDVFMAAQCLLFAAGWDGPGGAIPGEPANLTARLRLFLDGCLLGSPFRRPAAGLSLYTAWQEAVEASYGPRRFVPLELA